MTTNPKYLRLLGVPMLAILGLMAIGATAAQAKNEFLIAGQTLAALGGSETVGGSFGAGTLLEEGGITISCAKGSFSGTIESGGKGTGVASFGAAEKCKVGTAGVPNNTHCWVTGPIVGTGLVQTVLDKTIWYLMLIGLGAERDFAEFEIKGDGLCPVEENMMDVNGETALLIDTPETEAATHQVLTISLEEEDLVSTVLPQIGLFLGTNQAHFATGTAATVVLTGNNPGKKWSLRME